MIFYIVVISGCLALYLYITQRGKLKEPPGMRKIPIEKGLPIIGVVTKIERPLCNYLLKLSQKHGPIYQVRIGMRDLVVLNTCEYIKAALVDNGDVFLGRWKSLKHIFVTNNSGLIVLEGDVWSVQKSFVLKTMKDFGMGRSRSIEIVQEECAYMLEDLEKYEGRRINFANFIPIYTANVISRFVMNKRFSQEDPLFHTVHKIMKDLGNANDSLSNFLMMFPLFENHEWLIRFIMWVTSRKSLIGEFDCICQEEVENHVRKLELNSEGDDLMDRFLITQHQLKEKSGNIESFTNFQLVKIAGDLLAAGYDTTSAILVWTFMLMGMYPEIQNKVYEEINDKIGNERAPTMSDKMSLNYTQAVLDEISRLSSVGPLAIMHRTLNDVVLKGYLIPKDTVVIPNLFACHLDPNIWQRPFEFYPDHFLITDNNGSVKYRSREELIPFGVGRRQCIGESLARMEYFIFVTSVLQRYRVCLAEESERKLNFDVFRSNEGMVRTCSVTDYIFHRRH